ncbi:sensor histidine kinase [Desulfatitalea alkaliphila]|uniref:histidine kinase n=1 Tax=Desulfatitalea alkaliphila TaxID=2929485 RepID=A0AA41UJL7_9BACT|nr:ATP-binding protein [Desulfatitalea alkaliphila]MCJ8500637.1 ATP-binding protein [Desulfatitalea alkaliphila]
MLKQDRNQLPYPVAKTALLARLCRTCGQWRQEDLLLEQIVDAIPQLLDSQGSMMLLLDQSQTGLLIPAVRLVGPADTQSLASIRLPAALEMAGEVCRTGQPLIQHDFGNSAYAKTLAPTSLHHRITDRLDVPLQLQSQTIGTLCAINKTKGHFGAQDVDLLSALAGLCALGLETIRRRKNAVTADLRMEAFDHARDRVINDVSHALKTPLAVLTASLKLLEKFLVCLPDRQWQPIFQRSQRNLTRLLRIEYDLEDILRRTTEDGPNLDPDAPEKDHFFEQVNIPFLVHELKEPISVIETASRMLLDRQPTDHPMAPAQHRFIQRIVRNTRKARDMLGALLEVGRAQANTFQCESFAPCELLQSLILDIIEFQAPELNDALSDLPETSVKIAALAKAGIRLDVTPLAATIRMAHDETKFRQVVGNLLKNALYHRRHHVLIHLSCQREQVTVAVRDDGPGIAPAYHETIFQRYKQVASSDSVARAGHGLGLAIARTLARSMGGDITLESELGQGAVFRLTLPISFACENVTDFKKRLNSR